MLKYLIKILAAYHIMRFNFKYLFFLVLATFTLFVSTSTLVFGSDAEFTLYPSEGSVAAGEEFVVDVLIDTKGQEVVLARAVLSFDPNLAKLENAERNEDLFCDWPENEQMVDNENGTIMATGFCQSGGEQELYATIDQADIFARLTFTALQEGNLDLKWEFSGFDEDMKSVIMQDGSPPQNILEFYDEFLVHNYVITSSADDHRMPETNIPAFENISSTFMLGGFVFFLAFLTNILLDPKRRYFRKSRTVVVYDDEEK